MDIYKAKIGEKVYFDSFVGVIKAVYMGYSLSDNKVAIRITATKNHVYKHGEIVWISPLHVIPRNCYHKTGVFTYSTMPYEFEK